MSLTSITSLNHSGQGVCHIDGLVTFVDGALPGDRVKIRISEKKKNYQVGEITELIEASEDRVMEHLASDQRCGGCQLDHFSYEGQLKWKQQTVKEQLIRIAKIDSAVVESLTQPTLASPSIWHYRNKVSFPIGGTKDAPEIGFFEARSHRIVDADVCHAQPPISNAIRACIREWIIEHRIEPYNEATHSGLLRHAVIRIASHSRQIMLILVLNSEKRVDLPLSALESMLSEQCQALDYHFASFYLNYQAMANNLILGREFEAVSGTDHITERILDIDYRISPGAFFQINSAQTEVLYSEVLRALNLDGHERVFDLYCGSGSISLQLAKQAQHVTGIELFPASIDDARINAAENSIQNVDFYVGAAERVVPQLYQTGHTADVIVVDPPRKGCDAKLLETMLAMKAEKIVYVSCNPATLARDLKILLEGPYELASIQPVDMFPATSHVECVVSLIRK